MTGDWIRVRGAREHNLHHLDVDLPRGRLTVITGPSGSGKSSLAFDTLFAEGQRRYLETLRTDARAWLEQLRRPDVDLVEGLPPALAVEQQAGSARPRSTLATLTEIHDHLRLLWARLGTPHCYQCGAPIRKHSTAEVVRQTLALEEGRKVYVLAPVVRNVKGEHKEVFQQIRQAGFLRARVNGVLSEVREAPRLNPRQSHTVDLVVDRLVIRDGIQPRLAESVETAVRHGNGTVIITQVDDGDWHDRVYNTRYACPSCGITYGELEPRHFSFNNPEGACPACGGLGQVWELDPDLLIPDRGLPVEKVVARLRGNPARLSAADRRDLRALADDFGRQPSEPVRDWPPEAVQALLNGIERDGLSFPGLIPSLRRRLEEAQSDEEKEAVQAFVGHVTCPECGGTRLNREARSVRFAGKTLPGATALTVDEAADFFAGLPGSPESSEGKESPEAHIRAVVVPEVVHRLRFLQEVGLSYLTLDRPAPTLSGGELQRARLATHLGAGLLGVCYILDEPTVGLHPRDTDRLLKALRGLQRRGNTVLVVEHDEEVMRQADYLVDIGPGAGRHGGKLVAHGTVEEVLRNPDSVTAHYLRDGRERAGGGPRLTREKVLARKAVTITGARHHNLKDIDASFPLGCLVCVTGVSGSGKSSLALDILGPAARRHLGLAAPRPGAYDRIDGLDQLDKVIEVDQSPLGRSPRSSAATYTGVFDEVRKVFASTREAKARGYTASRFSFNVKGGRCEECQGQGVLKVPLHFLPDLTVPCPVCHGKRFNPATLEIRYRGKSVADVLDLSVEAARDFFTNIPALVRPLQALVDVGLGYLTLGQPSSHLSGGEAQRVKLGAELARTATGRTLFLMDEPTTGLHFADVDNLLRVFRRLVEPGNTVVVIEHNLDVIAAADWVIDLGPEGGEDGGFLVVAGTPEEVAACPASVTGRYLRRSAQPVPSPPRIP